MLMFYHFCPSPVCPFVCSSSAGIACETMHITSHFFLLSSRGIRIILVFEAHGRYKIPTRNRFIGAFNIQGEKFVIFDRNHRILETVRDTVSEMKRWFRWLVWITNMKSVFFRRITDLCNYAHTVRPRTNKFGRITRGEGRFSRPAKSHRMGRGPSVPSSLEPVPTPIWFDLEQQIRHGNTWDRERHVSAGSWTSPISRERCSNTPHFLIPPSCTMGDGRIFYVGRQSGGKAEGLEGKEKSILLNIKRVRKLKYWW